MREENIEKMNFKELRAEVQYLRDELAVFKRKMEDAMYNLDSDNFSGVYTAEQNDMKAQVKIAADAVSVFVAEKNNYATTEWTSEQITSTVKNYQTKADADDEYDELMTEITQTAGSITSIASKNMNAYFESDEWPTSYNTSTKQKAMLCLYEDTYYYYDDFYGTWKEYPSSGLQTMFVQDAEKFALTGNVKISGDLITSGSISGDRITGGTIQGVSVGTVSNTWNDGVRLQNYGAQGGKLEVLYGGVVRAHWEPAMEWYAAGEYYIGSYIGGDSNMRVSARDISASGVWDFSRCDSVDWGKNKPVAVFG